MSFYTGVVPADGLSAETGINWSLQQTRTNLQSPTSVRATSNYGNYAAPLTPAQAYARTFVSEQPVLQYTIERQQLEKPSDQQPGLNLQSLIGVSAPTRGQSYAQRLYASSLSTQPQAQTHQQPTSRQPSFERGESSKSRVPAGPRAPYGARASLMLNADHTNAPQTISALDFYHNSIPIFDLQLPQPLPGRGTNSPGAPHPQSATGSASRIPLAHSPVPIQVPHGLQAPSRRSPVPVEPSDGSPPSPAGDPRRSSQARLHSRNPHTTHVIPGGSTSSDIPLRPESVNNAIASPVPPETPLRESSSYLQDCSRGVVVTTSNPESVTRPGDSSPAPIQIESLGISSSEEVPLYSLVDDEPPPPDFDESQSMCSVIGESTYHAESSVILSLPDVPSPTPHESDSVSGAVPSTGADALSFVGTPRALSLEPLSGSPQTSLATAVASYPTGKAPEDVKEKSYDDSAKDSMPKFSERSSSMEALSSSRTPSEQVPSYRQSRYNTAPQDIPHPSSSPPGPPHNYTSAKTFSTAPLPALPLRSFVVPTPATNTASASPPMMPASPPLSPRVSAVKPAEVQSATFSSLRPGSSYRPSNSSLPPRVRAEPTFPSSAGTPPFMAASAGITSQMYYAGSPSPLSSPPLSQRFRGPSVLSASSTGSRPAEFRPQLSPDVSPTLQGQAPYQSPRETFQPPTEFRP